MRSLQIILWLTGFLVLTGLALMLLYVPRGEGPALINMGKPEVTAGSIFRGIHFWAGSLVVLAVLLHLGRTVFVKTNRRRAGWAAALFVLMFALSFTGFLLPWDQLTYWLPSWAGGLTGVYWTHTIILSLLLLLVLLAYTRRTRRDLAAS